MKTAIIITSVSAPNAVMKSYADESLKRNIDFIMIGDVKTPADFYLSGCQYYSIASQEKLRLRTASLVPKKHYSRKNVGYLLAKNHDVILETDDDNYPLNDFWLPRSRIVEAQSLSQTGWTNVYKYFSDKHIWPRGLPPDKILNNPPPMGPGTISVQSPIQQGLADDNPDVDAIYRMTQPLPIKFDQRMPIAMGNKSWCPFNSQNTTWFREAFMLLYLPSYCSFRMTDIWRSLIAQRIAWTCNWHILFHNATVRQDRNEHDLMKDFEDEIPGYLHNSKIARLLEDLDLRNGKENIAENLARCYAMLVENNIISVEELNLLEGWIIDMED